MVSLFIVGQDVNDLRQGQERREQCTFEIVSTEEGTFNFWALDVTDLRESSLLLYFCRINWAQDRLSLNFKDPCSTSPVSLRLSLSSGL